jgi:flagellar FliL protein
VPHRGFNGDAKTRMAAKDKDHDAGIEDVDGKAPKAGFGLRKLVFLVILPIVALIGTASTAYFLMFGPGAEHGAHEQQTATKATVFLDLPDMLVNLNTGGTGRASYLKLKVALEFDEAEAPKKVEALMPRVIDGFQTYLRELRADDLSGSAGLYRVKEELLLRISHAVQPIKVTDVLFKEMLVQQ